MVEAERLVRDGMKSMGMSGNAMKELPGSDPRKVAIAQAVHSRTAVPQGWIAEKLAMRSAANVSQHLRRMKRGELKLGKKEKEWLERVTR